MADYIQTPNVITPQYDFSHVGKIGEVLGNLVAKYPELKLAEKQKAYDENLNEQIERETGQFIENMTMDDNVFNAYAKATGMQDRNTVAQDLMKKKELIKRRPGEDPWKYKERVALMMNDIYRTIPNETKMLVKAQALGIGTEESNKQVKENMKKDALKMILDNEKAGKYDLKVGGDYSIQGEGDDVLDKELIELGLDDSYAPIKRIKDTRNAVKSKAARDAAYSNANKVIDKALENASRDTTGNFDIAQVLNDVQGAISNLDDLSRQQIYDSLKQRVDGAQKAYDLVNKYRLENKKADQDWAKAKLEFGQKSASDQRALFGNLVKMWEIMALKSQAIEQKMQNAKEQGDKVTYDALKLELDGLNANSRSFGQGLYDMGAEFGFKLGSYTGKEVPIAEEAGAEMPDEIKPKGFTSLLGLYNSDAELGKALTSVGGKGQKDENGNVIVFVGGVPSTAYTKTSSGYTKHDISPYLRTIEELERVKGVKFDENQKKMFISSKMKGQ